MLRKIYVVILMVMAAATMHRCKVCSAYVLEHNTRRVLGTKVSQQCTATLIGLATELGSTVEEATDFAKGYACQPCYRALEKYIDLTEKLKTLGDSLLQKLSIAIVPPSRDNIDKEVKPRHMTNEHQAKSLHYFHVFAVQDRINFNHLPNQPTLVYSENINFTNFYPTVEDHLELKRNFQVLMKRILVHNIHALGPLSSSIDNHILHQYTSQMSKKSVVVSGYCKCMCYCDYCTLYLCRYHLAYSSGMKTSWMKWWKSLMNYINTCLLPEAMKHFRPLDMAVHRK